MKYFTVIISFATILLTSCGKSSSDSNRVRELEEENARLRRASGQSPSPVPPVEKPSKDLARLAGIYDSTSGVSEDFFELKADGTFYLSQNGGRTKAGNYTVNGDMVVWRDAQGIVSRFIIEGDNLAEAGSDRMRIRMWNRRP